MSTMVVGPISMRLFSPPRVVGKDGRDFVTTTSCQVIIAQVRSEKYENQHEVLGRFFSPLLY